MVSSITSVAFGGGDSLVRSIVHCFFGIGYFLRSGRINFDRRVVIGVN
jgi:hypothetical protein